MTSKLAGLLLGDKCYINENRAWYIDRVLNLDAMNDAIKFFIGTHDFTSFRSAKCQANSPIKTIQEMKIYQVEDDLFFSQNSMKEIRIYIRAPSFLHNQVRIMVGQLVDIGTGISHSSNIKTLLQARNRALGSITAPAIGLYLYHIHY